MPPFHMLLCPRFSKGLCQQLVSERFKKRAGLRVDFRRRGAFGCKAVITAESGCLATVSRSNIPVDTDDRKLVVVCSRRVNRVKTAKVKSPSLIRMFQKKHELGFRKWWKRTLDRNGLDRKRLGLSQTRQGDDSGGRLLSCHRSVRWKRILCGDKQQPGMEDFGRDRGEGRVSGKSRDRVWKTLDVAEVKVGCPGKVLNRDERRVIKGSCEQMV
ncbi:unnamed protein product [Lactuca saligna]|uniref:Uncharacterized protein n=1 Tax=Lactuca saligna TaxID=75948 RepID=A0AA35Y6E2_LACSI|nr:unnamed protein product [Lactuca saligna]